MYSFNGIEVTDRQFDYLKAIEGFWIHNKYAPTKKDIQEILNLKSFSAVKDMLDKLQKKKLIAFEPEKIRTLRTKRMQISFEGKVEKVKTAAERYYGYAS